MRRETSWRCAQYWPTEWGACLWMCHQDDHARRARLQRRGCLVDWGAFNTPKQHLGYDHQGIFNVCQNLQKRAFSLFASIRKAATMARMKPESFSLADGCLVGWRSAIHSKQLFFFFIKHSVCGYLTGKKMVVSSFPRRCHFSFVDQGVMSTSF